LTSENITPNLDDMLSVFSNNPNAAQQLHIVTLERLLKEQQEQNAELQAKCDSCKSEKKSKT
jgi:hypothetical protein|tara:strand:- start:178 stop:363 length:186 start_codon:yes stop_codon:yes gene_type:complete